jgi:hypothetical protein
MNKEPETFSDWMLWVAENNVKLQPVIDKLRGTKWSASVVTLGRDGWMNVVLQTSPRVYGAESPEAALRKLYRKMNRAT